MTVEEKTRNPLFKLCSEFSYLELFFIWPYWNISNIKQICTTWIKSDCWTNMEFSCLPELMYLILIKIEVGYRILYLTVKWENITYSYQNLNFKFLKYIFEIYTRINWLSLKHLYHEKKKMFLYSSTHCTIVDCHDFQDLRIPCSFFVTALFSGSFLLLCLWQ